jgi:hypothetical protein
VEPEATAVPFHMASPDCDPRVWEKIGVRCDGCGRLLRGSCVFVGEASFHAGCYRVHPEEKKAGGEVPA